MRKVLGLLLASLIPVALVAQPVIGDCQIFPSNNVWNVPVDKLPVAAASTAYINSVGTAHTLHPDFDTALAGIPFVVVPANQPLVAVSFEYKDESDPAPYPIPANAPIEGGGGGGDSHVLVIQSDTCKLYEIFASSRNADGSWKAGAGAVFDLNANSLRPDTWTSADAAGLAILPGLIRYDEVAAGAINHAIRLTVPKTRKAHVWPARHDASSIVDAAFPPMGQRFRLKAGFDISSYPPDAQVILTALKKYGMILADNGSSWFLTGAPDPRWNMDSVSLIRGVTGANLEAVDVSSLIISPDSAQAKLLAQRTDVPFSGTPVFNLSANSTLSMTLAGDVASASVSRLTDGAITTFLICQDHTGGHVFTWPVNVLGGMTVNAVPDRCSAQQFVSDGTSLFATSPGSSNL